MSWNPAASVWMMTSKLPARNGSPLAAAATTPVRARSPAGEGVGLGRGGEAVGTPVAADDPLLD
jgi:hypothetical protein